MQVSEKLKSRGRQVMCNKERGRKACVTFFNLAFNGTLKEKGSGE